MTDLLTPEMEAMLRINQARQLASIPDGQKKRKRIESKNTDIDTMLRDVPSEPLRATETSDSVDQVLEYPEKLSEALSEDDGMEDAFSAHEILSDPIAPFKRGRGRPRKNTPITHEPAGVKRSRQIHEVMTGDWTVIKTIQHDTRDITTACGYKAKKVYVLKDKITGRVISAALGEILKHTSVALPADDQRARKHNVAASFA